MSTSSSSKRSSPAKAETVASTSSSNNKKTKESKLQRKEGLKEHKSLERKASSGRHKEKREKDKDRENPPKTSPLVPASLQQVPVPLLMDTVSVVLTSDTFDSAPTTEEPRQQPQRRDLETVAKMMQTTTRHDNAKKNFWQRSNQEKKQKKEVEKKKKKEEEAKKKALAKQKKQMRKSKKYKDPVKRHTSPPDFDYTPPSNPLSNSTGLPALPTTPQTDVRRSVGVSRSLTTNPESLSPRSAQAQLFQNITPRVSLRPTTTTTTTTATTPVQPFQATTLRKTKLPSADSSSEDISSSGSGMSSSASAPVMASLDSGKKSPYDGVISKKGTTSESDSAADEDLDELELGILALCEGHSVNMSSLIPLIDLLRERGISKSSEISKIEIKEWYRISDAVELPADLRQLLRNQSQHIIHTPSPQPQPRVRSQEFKFLKENHKRSSVTRTNSEKKKYVVSNRIKSHAISNSTGSTVPSSNGTNSGAAVTTSSPSSTHSTGDSLVAQSKVRSSKDAQARGAALSSSSPTLSVAPVVRTKGVQVSVTTVEDRHKSSDDGITSFRISANSEDHSSKSRSARQSIDSARNSESSEDRSSAEDHEEEIDEDDEFNEQKQEQKELRVTNLAMLAAGLSLATIGDVYDDYDNDGGEEGENDDEDDLSEITAELDEAAKQMSKAADEDEDWSVQPGQAIEMSSKIGKGATATVWSGLAGNRLVAVKRIELKAFSEGLKYAQRVVQREYDIVRSFRHINIVKYNGLFYNKEKEQVNLVMELVDGVPITDLVLFCTSLSENITAFILRQVLSALAFLHEKGIMHRDLKPDNILLTINAVIKLIDFGTATRYDTLNSAKRRSTVGTPWYCAPEVINSEDYSNLCDVWSVGCFTIEMVSGKPPFDDLNDIACLFKMAEGVPPPIPDGISSECNDFLTKCLLPDWKKRPSPKELLQHPFLQLASSKESSTREELVTIIKEMREAKTRHIHKKIRRLTRQTKIQF